VRARTTVVRKLTEKSVIRAPFRPLLNPGWYVLHLTANRLARGLSRFDASPLLSALSPPTLALAIRREVSTVESVLASDGQEERRDCDDDADGQAGEHDRSGPRAIRRQRDRVDHILRITELAEVEDPS
jgi:hypothetical protein